MGPRDEYYRAPGAPWPETSRSVTFRSKRLRRLVEATPTLLIHNGRILHANLQRERITRDDLHAALRRAGVADPEHVRVAVLEENGGISVIPRAAGGPGEGPGSR